MKYSGVVWILGLLALGAATGTATSASADSPYSEPWTTDRAIVLDGYEHNIFNLEEIASDERVTAFIHKASDGMPAKYLCKGDERERALCRKTWQRYAVSKELYQTRRAFAKSLGLKWGAYHLGRPGDPIQQAEHFLEYADPKDDDLLAIDIEGLDEDKWMSLEEAQIFAVAVKEEIGRYPVLYANETVSQYIADHQARFPILSRLPLWYARYKPEIDGAFPKGHWDSYHIWQFAYQGNCNERKCPYRVEGTGLDIDVNVVDMTPEELREAWPFGELLDRNKRLAAAEIPMPVTAAELVEVAMLQDLPRPVARPRTDAASATAEQTRKPDHSLFAGPEAWMRRPGGPEAALAMFDSREEMLSKYMASRPKDLESGLKAEDIPPVAGFTADDRPAPDSSRFH